MPARTRKTYVKKYKVKDKECVTAKGVHNIVKSELKKNIELKRISAGKVPTEFFLGDNTAGGGQDMIQISTIVVGTSDSGRIGDKVFPKKLELRMFLQAGLGSTSYGIQPMRTLVFIYKGDSSAEDKHTLMNKLFVADTSAGGGTARGVLANRNTDYAHLFTILWDHTNIGMSTQTASVAVPINASKFYHKIIRFKRAFINYVAGSSTTGQNNIYIMTWGDNVSVTENPRYQIEYQLHFTDA